VQYRGGVIVLSFLYSHCRDTCPLMATEIRGALDTLPGNGRNVPVLAITVDPDHDTPAAVQAFAAAHGLERNFAYLVGTAAQLRSVWSAYGVRVVPDPATPGHSDAIYLIDRKGRERALVHSDVGATDLLADLRMLLKER